MREFVPIFWGNDGPSCPRKLAAISLERRFARFGLLDAPNPLDRQPHGYILFASREYRGDSTVLEIVGDILPIMGNQ